jgi:uncharacterized protein (TIGR03083 family)
VHGVAVHVLGVEVTLSGWRPGGDHPFARLPAAVAELSELGTDELVARYHTVTAARLAEIATMTDEEFDAPSVTPVGPGTYGRFMAIREFDVWVHERDVRVPLGLAGDDAGPAAELALDEVQMSMGYIAGKKIGMPDGTGLAVELTGPVQRRLLVKVDGRAKVVDQLDDPTVTLTTDSLTFMLLACGRIDPEVPIADGRVRWTGDDELGGRAARNLAFTM